MQTRVVVVLLGQGLSPEVSTLPEVLPFHGVYRIQQDGGTSMLFKYAAMVCWGLSDLEIDTLVKRLKPFVLEPVTTLMKEEYSFHYDKNEYFSINKDHLIIPDDADLVRLAISYTVSQSVKLDFFELAAEKVISSTLHIPKKLSQYGRIRISRKSLAKLRGTLFDTSCEIILHFNLLDKPNFFWDYPELDNYYVKISRYLEMNHRVSLLNQKLTLIQELLDMLAEEQNHKHSSVLEWIIIGLIVLEILLFILAR